MRRFLATSALLDCGAEVLQINSQDDATELSKCLADGRYPMKDVELQIGQSATGVIDFSGFRLNGSITAENNPSLTGLVFKSDDPHFHASNNITSIYFR